MAFDFPFLDTLTNKCRIQKKTVHLVFQKVELRGGENIDLSNAVLLEMEEKQKYNKVHARYYYGMYKKYGIPIHAERYKNKSDRINDCLSLWLWDAYHQNKKLDLIKVNRCMDNKFCPNCRAFSLASAMHNFGPHFKSLTDKGYNPYLLTLTVPNVSASELKQTIEKMNKSFRKFFQKLSFEIGKGKDGFKDRLIQFDAALKVLEITYNEKMQTYHPHFHVMMFSLDYDQMLFQKNIFGAWSNKQNKQMYNSEMDLFIMKLWTMCYDGITINSKKFSDMSDKWTDLYMCDIKEMNEHGVFEVLKYTFKDTDILNYFVFETLAMCLDGKRLRQGYGLLYNIKIDSEDAEGELQELNLEIKENPEQLLTREIKTLRTLYGDYEKVSRFMSHQILDILQEKS